MSETDTESGNGPEKTNVNIRLTEAFLDDIDATWQEEGYNSRSEFMRDAIRDAVKHPGLNRGAWKDIAATEYQRRNETAESATRNEVMAMMNDDE